MRVQCRADQVFEFGSATTASSTASTTMSCWLSSSGLDTDSTSTTSSTRLLFHRSGAGHRSPCGLTGCAARCCPLRRRRLFGSTSVSDRWGGQRIGVGQGGHRQNATPGELLGSLINPLAALDASNTANRVKAVELPGAPGWSGGRSIFRAGGSTAVVGYCLPGTLNLEVRSRSQRVDFGVLLEAGPSVVTPASVKLASVCAF